MLKITNILINLTVILNVQILCPPAMKGPKLTIPFTGNKTYPTKTHNKRRDTTMGSKVNTDMHLLNEFSTIEF